MIEEHGSGKQIFRLRSWPHIPRPVIGVLVLLAALATFAARDQAWLVTLALGLGALAIALIARAECARAVRVWNAAVLEYAPTHWKTGERSAVVDE
jgi:hypothetical protein